MNRYSSVFPPRLATSSPAAFAEPPAGNKYRERGRPDHGRTSGDEIVDNDDSLPLADGILLELEDILDEDELPVLAAQGYQRTVPYSFW